MVFLAVLVIFGADPDPQLWLVDLATDPTPDRLLSSVTLRMQKLICFVVFSYNPQAYYFQC
jgi:hypothetical protein